MRLEERRTPQCAKRSPSRGGLRGCLAAILSILLGASVRADTPSREYQVKAVFLYNFTQFVTWPDTVFSSQEAPIVIGITGRNPFDSFLNEAVAGEKAHGRPIEVRTDVPLAEVTGCHLLFISGLSDSQIERLLRRTRNLPILTVSDHKGFAELGGVIELFEKEGKIRFRINRDAEKAAGLSLSSKLLSLAELVQAK